MFSGRGPQRFFVERYVPGGADLVGEQRVGAGVVIVEFGEFGRDVAGGLQGAGAEVILDRDVGGAARGEICPEHSEKPDCG